MALPFFSFDGDIFRKRVFSSTENVGLAKPRPATFPPFHHTGLALPTIRPASSAAVLGLFDILPWPYPEMPASILETPDAEMT